MSKWLSANEAAKYLGYKPETLREKLRSGVIRGRKFCGRWKVEQSALEAALKRHDESPVDIARKALGVRP